MQMELQGREREADTGSCSEKDVGHNGSRTGQNQLADILSGPEAPPSGGNVYLAHWDQTPVKGRSGRGSRRKALSWLGPGARHHPRTSSPSTSLGMLDAEVHKSSGRLFKGPKRRGRQSSSAHAPPGAHSRSAVPEPTAPYGNYHNYYGYRPLATDQRLPLIPPEAIAGKRVLDIGCNSGQLTLHLAMRYSPAWMLGIDLDAQLIAAAERNRRIEASRMYKGQANYFPESLITVHGPRVLTTSTQRRWMDHRLHSGGVDVLGEIVQSVAALPKQGLIKADSTADTKVGVQTSPTYEGSGEELRPLGFPENVSFWEYNFMTGFSSKRPPVIAHQHKLFDTVIGLSLTKWIHVHYRDKGLIAFFKAVYDLLVPGGLFILEPQPWESYLKLKNRSTMYNIHALTFQPNSFHDVLVRIGFTRALYGPDTLDGGRSNSDTLGGNGFSSRLVQIYRKGEQP